MIEITSHDRKLWSCCRPGRDARQVKPRRTFGCCIALLAGLTILPPGRQARSHDCTQRPDWEAVVHRAFAEASGGFSCDELLFDDQRLQAFLDATAAQVDHLDAKQACLTLLRLRKTGRLSVATTQRGSPVAEHVYPIAEIAARQVMDQFQVSTDELLADPPMRCQLQKAAERIQADVAAYDVRKAMTALRKRRRLQPELVLRVADWQRTVQVYDLPGLRDRMADLPKQPGVYLFRDASGYLYIGESINLQTRLKSHLSGSDRVAFADYLAERAEQQLTVELHVFPRDSPASKVTVRRAYESELIRSRQPRFNVRP